MAQRVDRGIALLFHDHGTRRGWVVSSTPLPHFTPRKDPVPILQVTGWAPGPVWTGGKSRPHRDSIPDRPARSQSLYRLSYPAQGYKHTPRIHNIYCFSMATTNTRTRPNVTFIPTPQVLLLLISVHPNSRRKFHLDTNLSSLQSRLKLRSHLRVHRTKWTSFLQANCATRIRDVRKPRCGYPCMDYQCFGIKCCLRLHRRKVLLNVSTNPHRYSVHFPQTPRDDLKSTVSDMR